MLRLLRPRLAAAGLAVALLTSLLCACRTQGSSPPHLPVSASASQSSFHPRPRDFRSIRALLATQARAIRAHDEKVFVSTLDPRQPRLVAQQEVLYANLSQLRISHLTYGVDMSALVPAAVPGNDPVLRPSVVEHLQIAGTLRAPVSNPVDMTFVRRAGHWLVGAVSEPKEAGHFDSPQERPWYGVPVAVRQEGPLTVLVDRSAADSLDGLTSAIRGDIAFDAHLLGVPVAYHVLVDATTNGLPYDFSSVSQEEAAAVTFALTTSDRIGDRVTGVAGMAIKLNPTMIDRVVTDAGILRHELTHYLLRAYSGSSPTWLTEGVATWVQYYPDDFSRLRVPAPFYASLMRADRALPSIGLFSTDPSLNYPISQAAVGWLVDRAGVPRLIELMKAYRSGYQGADSDALTSRLLRRVYGVTEAQVVAGAFAKLAEYQH